MTASIRIDPETGQKHFNTRAAKATHKIAGKGYSVIEEESLKTLPPPPPGAVFNAANEAAVEAFLTGAIPFGRLGNLVAEAVNRIAPRPADSLAAIEAAGTEARELVRHLADMVPHS